MQYMAIYMLCYEKNIATTTQYEMIPGVLQCCRKLLLRLDMTELRTAAVQAHGIVCAEASWSHEMCLRGSRTVAG